MPNEKHAGGRPRAKIDLDELEKLAAMNATVEEIGAWFKVSQRTIELRCREKKFKEAISRGRATGRLSLRRMQMKLAQEGNPTMQIWLGKQILGQRDRFEPLPEDRKAVPDFVVNVNDGSGKTEEHRLNDKPLDTTESRLPVQ